MGQCDLETDAALAQLNWEELSKTPGGEFAEVIGDLLMLVGVGSPLGIAGGISNLALKVRRLAGASYASNLIYAITAVRNDLASLHERNQEIRDRIELLASNPVFAEAISALALRAMHTSVKNRLKRLARIIVNGVREDDLEPENLDDMMRAAVELKAADIDILGTLYERDNPILIEPRMNSSRWHEAIQKAHLNLINLGTQNTAEHLIYRSSYSRLEALGLIQRFAGDYDVGNELYVLLMEGKKFYERLQEIAV